MILGDWHAEFKAEYHKEELCQVLKKFHWHFKFSCKTIQSISSQTPEDCWGGIYNQPMIYKFIDIENIIIGIRL